ncbi:MAG: hypothetical protein ABMB14_40380, partial [Myxococcota bacterium]
PTTDAAAAAPELRTYAVPPGYADRVVGALNRAFERANGNVARATAGPSGSVVVVGPPGVLSGVERLVAELASTPPEPPHNVRLDYWVVRGVPGEAARGPGLAPVSDVLDAVAAVDGPQSFALLAARSLTSLDGDQGKIDDEALELRQIASIEPGGAAVVADVSVAVPGGAHTETRLVLAPGKTAVLAQAGVTDEAGAVGQLYVLVRPTLP